jgi:hypothetical protein
MWDKLIPTPDDWRAGYQREWIAFIKWLSISGAVICSMPIVAFVLHALLPDWDFLFLLAVPVFLTTMTIAVRSWWRIANKQATLAKGLDASRGRSPLVRFLNERPILASAVVITVVLITAFFLVYR